MALPTTSAARRAETHG